MEVGNPLMIMMCEGEKNKMESVKITKTAAMNPEELPHPD
jgi:hypothetical protein